MPPRSTGNKQSDPTAFVLSMIHHLHDGKFDWASIAADNGITLARNVTSRLNTVAKPYGYKWEQGGLIKLEDKGGAAPATPVAKKGKESGSADGSSKKRKVEKITAEDDAITHLESDDEDDQD